jgi:glycerophosphoryl diester phosphodiesterase
MRIFAHRGASALAPENTLAAFKLALSSGVNGIETDIRCCASGEAVLVHDPNLWRTASKRGAPWDWKVLLRPVSTMSLSGLRRLSTRAVHEPVGLFGEVLEMLREHNQKNVGAPVHCYAELKAGGIYTSTRARLLAAVLAAAVAAAIVCIVAVCIAAIRSRTLSLTPGIALGRTALAHAPRLRSMLAGGLLATILGRVDSSLSAIVLVGCLWRSHPLLGAVTAAAFGAGAYGWVHTWTHTFDPRLPACAAAALASSGTKPDELTWISFSQELLIAMKRRTPEVKAVLIAHCWTENGAWRHARRSVDAGLDGINLNAGRQVTAELVRWMHARGKLVNTWVWRAPASNDHEPMWETMERRGVDVFTSNLPDGMRAWRQRRKGAVAGDDGGEPPHSPMEYFSRVDMKDAVVYVCPAAAVVLVFVFLAYF